MARIRYIKPAFFENSELNALKPLARLLFIGLWCWADREGRLLDRPALFKAAILPDDACSTDKLLHSLADSRFLIRYTSGNKALIQIVNWHHQRPHLKEPPSLYPAPDGYAPKTSAESSAEGGAKTGAEHQPKHSAEPRGGTRKVEGELGTRKVEGERGTGKPVPSTGPPAAGTAVVTVLDEDRQRAIDAFNEQSPGGILPPIVQWLNEQLDDGVSVEWLEAACREAALNGGRKPPKYLETIIGRWKRDGFQASRKGGTDGRTGQRADEFVSAFADEARANSEA